MSWHHADALWYNGAADLVEFAANWLLQSTLLIAAGLCAAALLRGRGSAVQSAIFRTTLLAAVFCPLASMLFSWSGTERWLPQLPIAWTHAQQTAVIDARDDATAEPFGAAPTLPVSVDDGTVSSQHAQPTPAMTELPRAANIAEAPILPALPTDSLSPPSHDPLAATSAPSGPAAMTTAAAVMFAVGWITGSGLLLLRLVRAWRRLAKLQRSAVPAERAAQQLCGQLAAELSVSAPDVLRSPFFTSPSLAGVWRPAVLLPSAEVNLPLREIFIHELAHLRRRDCLWNLFSRLSLAIFFYQPLLWIVARRLETSAEEVCDDYVVQLGGDRQEYASRLLDVAELSICPLGASAVGIVSLKSVLARRVARIMDSARPLSTRSSSVVLSLVIVGGLAITTLAGLVGTGASSASAETPSSAGAAASAAGPDDGKSKREPAADGQVADERNALVVAQAAMEPIEGRVISADGRAIEGAKLICIRSRVHDIDPPPPHLLATTDKEGRFRFTPLPPVPDDVPAGWSYSDAIIVIAPGHGFLWTTSGQLRAGDSNPRNLISRAAQAITGGVRGLVKLPPAGEAIRGQLRDINGRPVAGARVRIRWFHDEGKGIYSVKEAEARGVENPYWQVQVNSLLAVIEPVQLRDVLPQATTDVEGRFELRDIGANRLVHLLIEHPSIETTEIIARNQPGDKIVVTGDRHEEGVTRTLYPQEILHVAGPSLPVQGRVVDLDSQQPIANAVVRVFVIHGDQLHSSREREHFATRTDAEGRYRIAGLPMGDGHQLVAFTTGDVPYLPVARSADTSAGKATEAGEAEVDFRLKRGVWAEGRVYDADRSEPLTGEITYHFFRNPKWEESVPGLLRAYVDGRYWTNARGEFRVPVLPSRGILAFRYDSRSSDRKAHDRYPRGFGADKIAGAEDMSGAMYFPTAPGYLMPVNYGRVAEVAPQEGQELVHVDMPLYANQPATFRVVDEQGQEVTDCIVYGAHGRSGWQAKRQAEIQVEDLRAGERRKIFAFHRDRNLSGSGFVLQGSSDVSIIRLVPAARVRGRLVDADGVPVGDASLQVDYDKLMTEDNTAIWAPHPQLTASPTVIPVDDEGRFQLDGLVPGLSYNAYAVAPRKFEDTVVSATIGTAFEDLQVEAGEEKDLGDIVIQSAMP